MSFFASNDRIEVTDTNGETVFDTTTPMPFITTEIVTQVVHAFPDSGDEPQYQITKTRPPFDSKPAGTCSEIRCDDDDAADPCYRVEWDPEWIRAWNKVLPRDHISTYTIGSIDAGYEPDFLLATGELVRVKAGRQKDFGAFISSVPQGERISVDGSIVLETAYEIGGPAWLSRVMSVYVEGNSVKVEFKHSNVAYESRLEYRDLAGCYGKQSEGATPLPDDLSSRWEISFRILVGKFTP